ncbi:unnamed protein product [Adineta steineri]|uniref:Otopetrin-2 n=1 Tax=Adineta steineri TaxID=433720 RepID=A0A814ZA36_9BILA|nr:unnamed protein product [Adineta steineri]CAF3672734.1 unnamed protein product [Adineta steineri]
MKSSNNNSRVFKAVNNFTELEKKNSLAQPLPPLRPPPNRSPLLITTKDKHHKFKSRSPTSSLSLSVQSDRSENMTTSNPIQRNIPQSIVKSVTSSTTQTNILTKSRVPTIRDNIYPPSQQKSIIKKRRTPPPIPSNYQIDVVTSSRYMNQNNDSDRYSSEDQHSVVYAMHADEEESEIPKPYKLYSAQPATVNRGPTSRSSIQTNASNDSRAALNNHRRRGDKSPPSRLLNEHIRNDDINSIGLEIIRPVASIQRHDFNNNEGRNHRTNFSERPLTIIERSETEDSQSERRDPFLRPFSSREPAPQPPSYSKRPSILNNSQSHPAIRTYPFSNFLMGIGALIIVFLFCMILVLAVKEEQGQEKNLRITMRLIFTYIYAVSIIWMVWCTFDIVKFRREWLEITGPAADNQEEYVDITKRHKHIMFYFPDMHNTGGLFMRIGAGLLCMGSLILSVIEIARIIAILGSEAESRVALNDNSSPTVTIARLINYIFRFLFHCVQFTFLFRYGNLIINRYHSLAKIGLIHLIIANLCTWFEAIVFETLEQIPDIPVESTTTVILTTTVIDTTTITDAVTSMIDNVTNGSLLYFFKAASEDSSSTIAPNTSTLEVLTRIEESLSAYLYPCLIEYSLISLTVFFIMWRNVGQIGKQSTLRFGARHVFTINCSRASRGILIGGIIFLLTILTLIPTYILDADAISITHITEVILLVVSLITVCISYIRTAKLYYDPKAHVDQFDQALILITTVGDFAYSFFGLFASLLAQENPTKLPIGIEISIGILALLQTFFQTGFILDTLKRRTRSKQEIREKPGRESITALLLMNLAIWLHDSLSAKKVKLNPLQTKYYAGAWPIIQAFTSPLSIFYRFHSSVCLADIWQEVYRDSDNEDKHHLINDA